MLNNEVLNSETINGEAKIYFAGLGIYGSRAFLACGVLLPSAFCRLTAVERFGEGFGERYGMPVALGVSHRFHGLHRFGTDEMPAAFFLSHECTNGGCLRHLCFSQIIRITQIWHRGAFSHVDFADGDILTADGWII